MSNRIEGVEILYQARLEQARIQGRLDDITAVIQYLEKFCQEKRNDDTEANPDAA